MKNLSLPLLTVALLLAVASAPALTVPTAEDTSSTAQDKITPVNGAATSLSVSQKKQAFVRFDLSNAAVVPETIQPASVTSATLRVYIIKAKPAGDLTLHTVTQSWHEVGAAGPEPTFDATPLLTVPQAQVVGKSFITVDVTAAVKTALGAGGNDFGFAIATADPAARLLLGSKEGSGTGYPAELEIESQGASTGTENVTFNSVTTNVLNATSLTANGAVTSTSSAAGTPALAGSNTSATGSTSGVSGSADSTANGIGAQGGVTGVLGTVTSTAPGGYSAGVRGINKGTSGSGIGVAGYQAGSGWGVYGETPSGFGVYGLGAGANSTGVRGETLGTNGVGVDARYSGAGVGTALNLQNGAIKVSGTNKTAFIHTATAANKLSANGTDVDNVLCNGDANCLLFVTQHLSSGIVYNNSPIGVYYNTVRSKWEIFNESNSAIPVNAQFNVLVIKQ